MRAIGGMFGLVALLVTIYIMAKLFVSDAQTSITARDKADQIAMPLAGKDQNGQDIRDTYGLTADLRTDGKLQDLLVTRVTAGSQMDQYFGLKANDKIIAVVDNEYRQEVAQADSVETAKSQVFETATQGLANKLGQIIVKRGDQTLTLPNDKNSAAATPAPVAASPTPGQTPAPAPAPAAAPQPAKTQPPADSNDPMQQIRDRLHSVPGL
jgi:hypothetical protein